MIEYKHRPREERLKEIIFGQTLFAILILSISLYLIFWSFGYKINWSNFSFKHTGIIYIAYTPKDATVYINGEQKDSSSPFDISEFPGYYDVALKKEGFQSWTQSVKVEADKVYACRDITLFRQSPAIREVVDQSTIRSIDTPYDSLVRNPNGELNYGQYEIWVKDQLVTRFSEPISNVIWYPGMEYVAYQQGNEIRIIEKNGTNDMLLVTLSSDHESKFIFSWDGSELLFKDGAVYKSASIL